MYVCMYVCVCVHLHLYLQYIGTHTHTHTYIYIYMYIYAYIHISHMYMDALLQFAGLVAASLALAQRTGDRILQAVQSEQMHRPSSNNDLASEHICAVATLHSML